MTEISEILVLSQDPVRVGQWMRCLTGPSARLWQTAATVPQDVSIDVIVTDHVGTEDLFSNGRLSCRLAVGEIGVVRVGGESSADVCLPNDCTARELCLACSLLSETVRLRREVNSGRRLCATLNELAMTDPLTELPNRRAWQERLAQREPAAAPTSDYLCVALLDLDHFKTVNDRFGHLAGDRLLGHVGRQLASVADRLFFVARLGGDEFAVLFGGCNPSDLAGQIETIRILACEGATHHMTASVGLALAAEPEKCDRLQLLDAADIALRRAKATGRNRCVVVDALRREDLE